MFRPMMIIIQPTTIHNVSCLGWVQEQLTVEVLVPITNYGLVIAYSLGSFERVLQPFPSALETCHEVSRAGAIVVHDLMCPSCLRP